MRVRMLTASGDYSIGQGQANFYINSPLGVAQKVDTRLLLWEGEWFLDVTVGTPWLQEILGYGTVSLRDIAIKAVILGTVDNQGNPLVTSIESYSSVASPVTRELTVSGTIITVFSPEVVPFGPVVL